MSKKSAHESPSNSLVGFSSDESHSSTLSTRKRRRLVNASQVSLFFT